MNEIINLYNLFNESTGVIIIVTILSTFLLWIYKDNRVSERILNEKKIQEKDLCLQHLCSLESILHLYKHTNSPEFNREIYKEFGLASPFVSENIRKAILEFYKDDNSSRIPSIIVMLNKQIIQLKKERQKIDASNNEVDSLDYILGLLKPIKPIIILVLVVIFSVFMYVTMNNQSSFLGKLEILSFTISLVFSITFLYLMLLTLSENFNRIKKDLLFLGISISIILSPFLFVILNFFFFISLVIQILLLAVLIKRKSKEKRLYSEI